MWVLDGDPEHSHLLEFALNEETFSDTTLMFTVSMTTPWAMLEQLQNWATLLQDHIDKLNLSADFVQERKLAGEFINLNYSLQSIFNSIFDDSFSAKWIPLFK